jgi:hypothetical protein
MKKLLTGLSRGDGVAELTFRLEAEVPGDLLLGSKEFDDARAKAWADLEAGLAPLRKQLEQGPIEVELELAVATPPEPEALPAPAAELEPDDDQDDDEPADQAEEEEDDDVGAEK